MRGHSQNIKIFVLADDDKIVPAGVLANIGVGGVSHIEVENMVALRASGCQQSGECRWQLVIDQKLHDAWRTV